MYFYHLIGFRGIFFILKVLGYFGNFIGFRIISVIFYI